MAERTLKVTTPVITGASIAAASGTVASSDTMVISATTAQSALDMSSLVLRVANANTTAAVTLSLAASGVYSARGIGAATVTVATGATVVVGGQNFESARFLAAGGTLTFTQTGAGPTSWEAYQAPRASE